MASIDERLIELESAVERLQRQVEIERGNTSRVASLAATAWGTAAGMMDYFTQEGSITAEDVARVIEHGQRLMVQALRDLNSDKPAN